VNVVALGALKHAESETHACRHDASKHHVTMALGASGVMDVIVDVFGPGTKFRHDASLEQAGAGAQLSQSPVICPWARGDKDNLGFMIPIYCSVLTSWRNTMKPRLMRPFQRADDFQQIGLNGPIPGGPA
jgi:hypothetical protein